MLRKEGQVSPRDSRSTRKTLLGLVSVEKEVRADKDIEGLRLVIRAIKKSLYKLLKDTCFELESSCSGVSIWFTASPLA